MCIRDRYSIYPKDGGKKGPWIDTGTTYSSILLGKCPVSYTHLDVYKRQVLGGTMFDVPVVGWGVHKFIIIKSFIVLSSWIFGYFGMKHLPLTIVEMCIRDRVYGVNEHECIDRSIKSSQIYNIKSIIFLFRLYFLTLAF